GRDENPVRRPGRAEGGVLVWWSRGGLRRTPGVGARNVAGACGVVVARGGRRGARLHRRQDAVSAVGNHLAVVRRDRTGAAGCGRGVGGVGVVAPGGDRGGDRVRGVLRAVVRVPAWCRVRRRTAVRRARVGGGLPGCGVV